MTEAGTCLVYSTTAKKQDGWSKEREEGVHVEGKIKKITKYKTQTFEVFRFYYT